MPSSNKTLHLQLNKWLGPDKPKKDDFNNDNQKIDEACRLLEQSITLLESTVQNNSNSIGQTISSLSASITSQASTLSAHTGNSSVHVTQSEKDAWSNNSGAVIGTYQGNGSASQKITLSFSPLFVLVFPVGDGLARVNWGGEMFIMNSGCASTLGSSIGITLNSDGFTVEHQSSGGLDGFQIKYNTSGIKYIYIAFKK